jgi:hypothetical protein
MQPDDRSPVDIVADRLERYATRGVFRGFSRGPVRRGRATFALVWHRDREFEFVFDTRRGTMRFPEVLPNVPAGSPMHGEFKRFVRSRQSDELPEHRRIEPAKSDVRVFNRGGNLSLTLKVRDEDYDYGVQKLIHLVHEVFLVFLYDGRWRDYMIENLGLDPDRE